MREAEKWWDMKVDSGWKQKKWKDMNILERQNAISVYLDACLDDESLIE